MQVHRVALATIVCWHVAACGGSARLEFGTLVNDEGEALNTDTTAPITESDAPELVPAPSVVTVTPAPTQPAELPPVRGRVADFWGHPVPNVQLDVGGIRTTSGPDGSFQALSVPQVYDVSMVIEIDGEASERYAWTYQELTTRVPVLPVYRGLPPRRATLRLQLPSADGEMFPCGALAFGGEHGHDAFKIFQASSATSVVWRGVEAIDMNVHALFWESGDPANCDAPETFTAWRQYQRLLEPGSDVMLLVENVGPDSETSTRSIEATASNEGTGSLEASLFLRFPNGATLPVVSREVAADTAFSLPAPVIDETTVLVAASRVGAADYAVDYQTLGSASSSAVALRTPRAPTLTRPAAEARGPVDTTVFEWASDSVSVLVVTELDAFHAQFLVTSKNRVTLPDLSHLGFELAPDVPHSWDIEVHHPAPTVDEWLEVEGGLDPFSTNFSSPVGLNASSGQFARSEVRRIFFAPGQ